MFFNLFGSKAESSSKTTKEETNMSKTTQYVVYTREFKTRAKQIGVFAEPARAYTVNGAVHGGKIKFKNLAVKNTARKTATNKLLSKGIDFNVNVLTFRREVISTTYKLQGIDATNRSKVL